MDIVSVVSSGTGDIVAITMQDGSIWHDDASLPPDTEVRRALASWIGGGGVIGAVIAEVPVHDITRRQLRLWLVRNGVSLASVEAAIDTMPEPARTEAQIEWQDASVYKLSNPLVVQIGAAVGLSDPEMLKQAFRDAALI